MSGRLAFASPPDAIAAMFPAASGWLGPRRVAALAATTLLVGMVCPGLHSIYAGFTVEACDEAVVEDRLGFRVTATDPRVRLGAHERCGRRPCRAPSRATLACRPRPRRRCRTWLTWSSRASSAGPRL